MWKKSLPAKLERKYLKISALKTYEGRIKSGMHFPPNDHSCKRTNSGNPSEWRFF